MNHPLRPLILLAFWLCFATYTSIGMLGMLIFGLIYRLSNRRSNTALWALGKICLGWGKLIVIAQTRWLGNTITITGNGQHICPQHWWIITANHQSWIDIVVLNYIIRPRVDDLRFVLKASLRRIPVMGWIIRLLDYPAIDRGERKRSGTSARQLAQENQLRIAHACQWFKHRPLAMFVFPEGTRFSATKQQQQKSPYQNLLKPRYNGLKLVVDGLATLNPGWLDISIHYHGAPCTVGDWFLGRFKHTTIDMHICQPAGQPLTVSKSDLLERWQAKDALLNELSTSDSTAPAFKKPGQKSEDKNDN